MTVSFQRSPSSICSWPIYITDSTDTLNSKAGQLMQVQMRCGAGVRCTWTACTGSTATPTCPKAAAASRCASPSKEQSWATLAVFSVWPGSRALRFERSACMTRKVCLCNGFTSLCAPS